MDETESRRVKGELAKDMDKEDMKLCFDEESSKEAFESCLEMLDSSDKVKDRPSSACVKEAGQQDEAAVEAVGEIFKACMEEATSDTEKAECRTKRKQQDELVKMGLKKRAFGLVKKLADLKAAAETYAACQETSATENTTCIELAKSTLEELRLEQGWAGSGLEKRPTWR
eukprot:g24684.t1